MRSAEEDEEREPRKPREPSQTLEAIDKMGRLGGRTLFGLGVVTAWFCYVLWDR